MGKCGVLSACGWALEPALPLTEEEDRQGEVCGDCQQVDGQYGTKMGYQPVNTRAGQHGEADD